MTGRTTPKGTRPRERKPVAQPPKPTGRAAEKVVAAYPYSTQVAARFHHSLLNVFLWDAANHRRLVDCEGLIVVSSGANITNARNEIVETFLDHTEADWLWFIDTDMVFDGNHRQGIAGPDLLDRLVAAADPVERPIVGALCFALREQEARPTVYGLAEDGKIVRYTDYPRGELFQTFATGSGCLLIHRSVLVAMREKYPKPYQWFREDALGGIPVGEDITFCARANILKFPVFVDSRICVGHEKPFVVEETMFLAQKAWRDEQPQPPTFVVIPGRDRHTMTASLAAQLVGTYDRLFLYDNGSSPSYAEHFAPYEGAPVPIEHVDARDWPLHRMWNDGLDRAEAAAKAMGADEWQVAILNNDLTDVPPDFLHKLAVGVRRRDDYMVSYPHIHEHVPMEENQLFITTVCGGGPTGRSLSGWAFMVKGETGLRFDEQFEWWFGDDDLERQVHDRNGQVVMVNTTVTHLEPNKSTVESPERQAMAERDHARFFAKYPDLLPRQGEPVMDEATA